MESIVMNNELISKFQELKTKQNDLLAEKLKYEAKRDQLKQEITEIQNKYVNYDLSTIESVEKIIADLTEKLNNELSQINEQYKKLSEV